MDYNLTNRGQEVTAILRGRLTATDAGAFREMLKRIESSACATIVFDLSGVAFADSAALSLMILAHRQGVKAGRSLTLRGLSGQLKRVFELTELDQILTIAA